MQSGQTVENLDSPYSLHFLPHAFHTNFSFPWVPLQWLPYCELSSYCRRCPGGIVLCFHSVKSLQFLQTQFDLNFYRWSFTKCQDISKIDWVWVPKISWFLLSSWFYFNGDLSFSNLSLFLVIPQSNLQLYHWDYFLLNSLQSNFSYFQALPAN